MIRTSKYTDSLWPALFKVQQRAPMITKGKEADTGKYKYRYADIGAVWEAIQPILKESGLVAIQTIEDTTLTTRIIHVESAEWYESDSPIADPKGCKAQEIGGAQTYARRYGLMTALFLIAAGDDDDARASHEARRRMEVGGYREDAVANLVKLGMSPIDAEQALNEEIGDRKDHEISRRDWVDIFLKIKAQIPGQEQEDPLLTDNNRNTNGKAGK